MGCLSRRLARLTAVLAVSVCAVGLLCASAFAVASRPGWEVTSTAYPTHLRPGSEGHLEINVFNVGAAHSSGPVTVTDTLPPGVTAISAGYFEHNIEEEVFPLWDCSGTSVVTCTSDPVNLPSIPFHHTSGDGPLVAEGPRVQLGIVVQVAPGVEGTLANEVSVSGGGASAPASVSEPIVFSSTSVSSFGFSGWDGWFSSPDGTTDTQAGSHPYAASFGFELNTAPGNQVDEPSNQNFAHGAGGTVRRVNVSLPAGLVGNPTAVPQCSRQLLNGSEAYCPVSTMIGLASVDLAGFLTESAGGLLPLVTRFAVYNMVPPPGMPAEFGLDAFGIPVLLDAGVRSGSDYGVTEHINNFPQDRRIVTGTVMLWGEPADPRHDFERWDELARPEGYCNAGCSISAVRKPFLTLPTSCGAPLGYSIAGSPWTTLEEASTEFFEHDGTHSPVGLTGCEHLSFNPTIAVAPETSATDTPTGLTVDVGVPQDGLVSPEGLATADLKDAKVVLPQGMVVNPARANGLSACQTAESGLGTEGPASCPASSRIGSVRITTPLLSEKIEGGVYVLQSNPPDLKLLVAGSGAGVNVKVAANVHMDESTGQLTTTFTELPQVPVSDIKLSLDGGSRGALLTPRACGTFTTTADFTPWSTPATPDALLNPAFAVDSGVGGGACPGGEPFSPAMTAGTANNQAGGFSAFSTTLSRQDDEQDLGAISVTTPPGLLAVLKSAERCPEPQASQGACGPNSLIGHTTVAVGAGPDPLWVQGGEVFLTGPYKGAPFGLSIVVHAIAGPFNLGNVVVRAAISVDPHTAQPTIASDPLPRVLDGVPVQIEKVNVTIDRAGFMFNPTSCDPLAVTGTLTSAQGASAPVSSRFQAANCAGLGFHPSFTASTKAATSKKNGASLDVKVGYPAGSQANIRSTAVVLPKQLPARLTTIQQACPEAVFAANPASCPAGSNIGTATASTPVLANSLSGPAYLVSHGGAAFPNVTLVLQGEGVTLVLVGSVNIKHGITSSTFASIPDAPISSFELNLPEGPHSGLAAVLPAKAKGNLCGTNLTMPTTITAQNGAQIKQNTKIQVTGCPKSKHTKKKAKGKKHRNHKGGRKG
jgi:uncharacterized repeat protein (TIGR01451 family)